MIWKAKKWNDNKRLHKETLGYKKYVGEEVACSYKISQLHVLTQFLVRTVSYNTILLLDHSHWGFSESIHIAMNFKPLYNGHLEDRRK